MTSTIIWVTRRMVTLKSLGYPLKPSFGKNTFCQSNILKQFIECNLIKFKRKYNCLEVLFLIFLFSSRVERMLGLKSNFLRQLETEYTYLIDLFAISIPIMSFV